MDYDLSRLSARSFEQLVQSLAVRHFGPGVVIFGDGPDGGREATYSGASSFGPHGIPWNGNCVIQAKFRQRPLGTGIDGQWALDALADELTKFSANAGGRPRPDYYIFVTNAVLSPGTDGSKDKAADQLDRAKNDWGLRDFDIWDYDKLRTWLDVDSEVRTRFGWITAGDVLAAVLHSVPGAGPNFEDAIVNYLEKTLVADRFVRLEEAGHSAEEPTPLSNVFIDLPVVGENPLGDELFMRQLLDHTATLGQDESDPGQDQQRIVLVGGPGQGKTTVGQFACQIFRASLLAARGEQKLSPEGRAAVTAVEAACSVEDLPFGRAPRFPLRVILTDLAKTLTEREVTLIGYLAELVATRIGSSISPGVFREWLALYPWFLVLDGLDEVPASAGRDQVMRCITDFWVDAAQAGADVVVLATTRPQGYNNDFSPERYQHVHLAELPAERALDYGNRLAEARYGTDSDRTSAVRERLSRAAGDPTTVHLMRSPLQVAIMTALVDRYGQPPHERWSLFDAYYDVIYQRERERDTEAANILREYRPDIDAIHQHVGLALQVLTTHVGHSDPRLTAAQLERVIDARLLAEGHKGPGTEEMAAQIRSAAELRLVFLVGAESDRIGFEIRSLQEFMAAGALVDGPDEQVIARLAAIAPLPAWRNVLLFAAGECFVGRQYLRNQLHALCRELDVDPRGSPAAAGKTGARLALDLLEDRTARRQPKHHRVIAAHALDMLSVADQDASVRLARCYDDYLDDLYQDAIGTGVVSSDEISRTGARRCLIALNEAGVPWSGPMLYEHPPDSSREVAGMLDQLPPAMVGSLAESYVSACLALADYQELERLTMGALRQQLPGLPWSTRQERTRQVAVIGLDGFHFSLSTILPPAAAKQRQRSTTPAPKSPALSIYEAADRFIGEPTPEGLSAALADIAQSSNPDTWRQCVYAVPWPMGVQLVRSATSEQLLEQSRLVGEGEYGSRSDWLAAEERWGQPASLPECLTATPVPFPIEVANATVTVSKAHSGLPWLDTFREFALAKDPRLPRLAYLMLWLLGTAGASEERPDMAQVIEVARAAGPDLQYLQIGVFDANEADESELTTLLESLSPAVRFVFSDRTHLDDGWDKIVERVVLRLERQAVANGSTRALEALAVALASMRAPIGRPIVVSPAQTGPVGQATAAFIAFITNSTEDRARALGERFASAQDIGTTSLLNSPLAQTSPDWTEFLIGLHHASPRLWREQVNLERMMSEVLSRLETPLADPVTWREMDLFEPHPLSLAEPD